MFGWLRKSGDRVDYQTPPAEARDPAEALAELEQCLENFRLVPHAERTAAMWRLVDYFLDQRLAMRQPRPREVPVVPGRAEASITNYWENPW